MRSNISKIIKSSMRLVGIPSDKQFLNSCESAKDPEELAQEQRVDREMLARLERYMTSGA